MSLLSTLYRLSVHRPQQCFSSSINRPLYSRNFHLFALLHPLIQQRWVLSESWDFLRELISLVGTNSPCLFPWDDLKNWSTCSSEDRKILEQKYDGRISTQKEAEELSKHVYRTPQQIILWSKNRPKQIEREKKPGYKPTKGLEERAFLALKQAYIDNNDSVPNLKERKKIAKEHDITLKQISNVYNRVVRTESALIERLIYTKGLNINQKWWINVNLFVFFL